MTFYGSASTSADLSRLEALGTNQERQPTPGHSLSLTRATRCFCIAEWVDAGWQDPQLVGAAVRICETPEQAEACMRWLGRDAGERYEDGLVGELARAMIELARMARG